MHDNRDELERQKLQAETCKLEAEARKLSAEMGKLRRETLFYPLMVISGIATVGLTAAALIIRL